MILNPAAGLQFLVCMDGSNHSVVQTSAESRCVHISVLSKKELPEQLAIRYYCAYDFHTTLWIDGCMPRNGCDGWMLFGVAPVAMFLAIWHTILRYITSGVQLIIIYLCMHYADIDECKDLVKYPCRGECKNKEGSSDCTCPPRYRSRDPRSEQCIFDSKLATNLAIGIYYIHRFSLFY